MRLSFFCFIFICCLSINLNSQSVSQNWTHTDCISGNAYTLFNMLDSNKVVVMEFEMGCSTCNYAAQYLDQVKQSYDVSHPGQVKFFAMDYWPSHTCTNIQTFVNNNALTFSGFVGCAADKNYYSSASPMPMIVITGGPGHNVYYKQLFYDSTQNVPIVNAIDQALSDIAQSVNNSINSYPELTLQQNNLTHEFFVSVNSQSMFGLQTEVFNLAGEKISFQNMEVINKGDSKFKLNLPHLPGGIYFLKYASSQLNGTLRFISTN